MTLFGTVSNMKKTEARITNETKLADLYEEYYDKIARYVFVHIGNRAEAEDLAANVFLRALDSLDKFETRGIPMQAWLFKIAHNLMVDHLRKAAKRRTVSINDIEIRSNENVEKDAEKRIYLDIIYKAMEHLTPSQREVIKLRFFTDLSSKEVGQLLNKSDGAVREMQRAAMESLRLSLVGNESE